jgi:mRNA-degrading endonuclease RelE of RelBE toxin-antitoxin system
MNYQIRFDKKFTREYRKIDRSLQIEGDKKLKRLKEDPENIGKPLKYFTNLYELHLQSFRIYYIVDKVDFLVFVLTIRHKNEQDKFLRNIKIEDIKKIIEENS